MPLKAEMEQGTWKEAADRLGQLFSEAGDELMAVEGGTISFSTWAKYQQFFKNPALAEAFNTLFDERARQMLDVARLAGSYRPVDLLAVARLYPLTETGKAALAATADRAMELGDAVTATALYERAAAAGWKADTLHEKRLAAIAAIRQPSRVGRLPVESRWYLDRSKWSEEKVMPLFAGNKVFIETSTGLSAVADGGNSLWSWIAPKPMEVIAGQPPVQPWLTRRGEASMPGVLLELEGSPKVVISRLPQSQSADPCVRAFRASDGRPLWTTEGDEAFATTLFIGQPLVSGGSVYCVAADDGAQGVQLVLMSLDVMTGALRWQRPLAAVVDSPMPRNRMDPKKPPQPPAKPPAPREAEDIWVQSQPALDDECVYVSPGVGCVYAIGRVDGKIRWTRRYPSLATPDDRYPPKPLGAMDANAVKQWEARSRTALKARFSNTPAVSGKTLVVAPYDFGGVLGLDKSNGNLLWEMRDLDTGTLIGATDKTAVFAGQAVSAVDATTGREAWRQEPVKPQKFIGPPSLIGGVVYSPTTAGTIMWNADDGRPAAGAAKLPDGSRIRIGQ